MTKLHKMLDKHNKKRLKQNVCISKLKEKRKERERERKFDRS